MDSIHCMSNWEFLLLGVVCGIVAVLTYLIMGRINGK